MPRDYPLVLTSLRGVPVLVVGGGTVATHKVSALCDAGAVPLVVSPDISPALQRRLARGRIRLERRRFRARDVTGQVLVFAATNDAELNRRIATLATSRRAWVNVASDASSGTFHTPAQVRRGALLVTASTSGAHPGVTALVREGLRREYDAAWGRLLPWLVSVRAALKRAQVSSAQRRALWKTLDVAPVLRAIRRGAPARGRAMLERQVARWRSQVSR